MSEFENIQRLIRLKRFETPGDDFVEDFVTQFRERQRSEMLRQSARGLLWERLSTYFEDLVSPKWALASATACVAVVASWSALSILNPGSSTQLNALAAADSVVPVSMTVKPAVTVDSQLIREAEQGRQLEIEGILLSRHFDSDEVAVADEQNVVSVSGAAMPVSAELLPVSFPSR
jgi:hypothetical protein